MIRMILVSTFICTASSLIGQTCLDSLFTTNGTGLYQLSNSGPVGNTVGSQVNAGDTCIDWDNQPTGPYDFLYIVATDCCVDTSLKNFYNMDLGEITALDFTICMNMDDPVLLTDQFETLIAGVNADYEFSTTAIGFSGFGDWEIETYDPIDTIGTYDVVFTCTPIAPPGYVIHDDCLPVEYTFEIIVENCCQPVFVGNIQCEIN